MHLCVFAQPPDIQAVVDRVVALPFNGLAAGLQGFEWTYDKVGRNYIVASSKQHLFSHFCNGWAICDVCINGKFTAFLLFPVFLSG